MTDADKSTSLGFDTVPDGKSESFAFAEMITCDACLRVNPPTRSNCVYCAAILPVTRKAPQARPVPEAAGETNQDADAGVQTSDLSRACSPENPNKVGILNPCYVVLAPNQTNAIADSSLAEISGLLALKAAEVESAISLGHPVPLARATTLEEATILADKLRALGIGVDILSEDALNLDSPARKIRTLEFSDNGLNVTLLRGEGVSLPWDELILIVTGRLQVNRTEVEVRRRRGRAKPLDTRELFADESVADLYARSNEVGCRIYSSSFDFSCLGTERSMTAFENFTTLINLLRMRAPNVEVDHSYRNLRAVLANVWPLEPQTRKSEWRRRGAGKVDISTVTTIDNETQFNSYSRLRQQSRLDELECGR